MDTCYAIIAISLPTLSLHCPLPSVTEHISKNSSFLTFPSAALAGNAPVKSGSFTGNVFWVPELQRSWSTPEPACSPSPCRDSASLSCLAAESMFCHLSYAATAPVLAVSNSGTHAHTCKRLPGQSKVMNAEYRWKKAWMSEQPSGCSYNKGHPQSEAKSCLLCPDLCSVQEAIAASLSSAHRAASHSQLSLCMSLHLVSLTWWPSQKTSSY